MFRKLPLTIFIIVIVSLGQLCHAAVKNIVLMIGDGMGFEQVKAASFYAYGKEEKLPFEKYYRGEVTTHSANSYTNDLHATDSAASATAMATGQKVNDDVVSQRAGKPIETILEISKKMGKATGLVTTKYLTDATPAAFGAHTSHDNNRGDIANDYLNQTKPNILFGAYLANGKGMTADKAKQAGYTVVKTQEQMNHVVKVVDQNSIEEVFIAGLFSPDEMPWEYDYYYPHNNPLSLLLKNTMPSYDTIPHLSEMTKAALSILDNDPNGFFLMVEGARIDSAGHDNLINFSVFETLEFAMAFQMVLDWTENRDDTLIIVTADHECGGLRVVKNHGKGFMPEVFWGLEDHTGANVPIYTVGQGAEEFKGVIDNTQIFSIMKKSIETKSTEGDTSLFPNTLSGAAEETYIRYSKAVNVGSSKEIPKQYWTDRVKALNPIKVYIHRVNVVVVQKVSDNIEQGKYIYIPISSYLPQSGDDGFTFTKESDDIYNFTRNR